MDGSLDCYAHQQSDDEDEDMIIDEVGHLLSLREYQALDIDRDPLTLEAWIHDLADGTDLGDGWREVSVPHFQPRGLPGRYIPRARASLAKLTKEARAVSVGGRLVESDLPLSHWKSLARLLHENNAAHDYPMILTYCENYKAWRALWQKHALTALGYGGIPDGDTWNPVTWTLYVQLRSAAARLLELPQYQYLQGHFAERPHPLMTRLYYALCADETHRVLAAKADFELGGFAVRGLIYDSILSEGTSDVLLQKHGLVVKEMPCWKDNLFMVLRHRGERTEDIVNKVPGKKMCIPSACANVGSQKVRKAVESMTRNGPHTYISVQHVLLAKRTMQYLKTCSAADIAAAPPGSAFLMHTNGHCVGLSTAAGEHIFLSDSSYQTKQKYTRQGFKSIVEEFTRDHPSTKVVYFQLVPGRHTPEAVNPDFMLTAAGKSTRRPPPCEAMAMPAPEQVLQTSISKCITCKKNLSSRASAQEIQTAAIWTGSEWETAQHGSKRCKCGLRYRLSFYWDKGQKRCTLASTEGDAIYLVSNNFGFKMSYLRCHYNRVYRNAISAQGEAATMILSAPEFEGLSEQYLRKYLTRAFIGFLMLLEGRRGFNIDCPLPDNDPEYGKVNKGFFTIFNAALHDEEINEGRKTLDVVTDGSMVLGRHMVSDEKPFRKRLAKRPSSRHLRQTCQTVSKHGNIESAQTQLGGLFATVSMREGRNEIVHLGEMLNSECFDYKEQALLETLATCNVRIYCHDCACALEPKFHDKVGRCLVDSWHVKKHKCDKAKFDPKHPKHRKFMKCLNSQAAEQLWSRMNKFHFATHMGRANYRAFMRHYCIWRNKYIRAQGDGVHRRDVSGLPNKRCKKKVIQSKSRCGKSVVRKRK